MASHSLPQCCNNPSRVEDHHTGDLVCQNCGKVADGLVEPGPEWRTFSNNGTRSDPSRVGPSEDLPFGNSNLSTMIDPASGESGDRLRNLSGQNISSTDQTRLAAFQEIVDISHKMNLPLSIRIKAQNTLLKIQAGESLRGKSTNVIAAACMYSACKQDNAPRTLKEICAVSHASEKQIDREYRRMVKQLGTEIVDSQQRVDMGDYIPRFCCHLELSNDVRKVATHVAKKAVELDLVRGTPPTIAAAAIYTACQASSIPKTPKEICEASGVNVVSIRNHYKVMRQNSDQIFPSGFVPRYQNVNV